MKSSFLLAFLLVTFASAHPTPQFDHDQDDPSIWPPSFGLFRSSGPPAMHGFMMPPPVPFFSPFAAFPTPFGHPMMPGFSAMAPSRASQLERLESPMVQQQQPAFMNPFFPPSMMAFGFPGDFFNGFLDMVTRRVPSSAMMAPLDHGFGSFQGHGIISQQLPGGKVKTRIFEFTTPSVAAVTATVKVAEPIATTMESSTSSLPTVIPTTMTSVTEKEINNEIAAS